MCRKFSGNVSQARGEGLVEVAQRAGAGAARIATGAATAGGNGPGRRAFGRRSKHTELRAQLCALTLGTLGLVAAKDQCFKLVLTLLADVFKNRHGSLPRTPLHLRLNPAPGPRILPKRVGDVYSAR